MTHVLAFCSAKQAVYPDVLPLLHELRKSGWHLGVLSNFDSRLLKVLADLKIAHIFDFILLPMHTGVPKPDVAAFLAALDAAGVSRPEQILGKQDAPGPETLEEVVCVHIGDSVQSDIAGAAAAGMYGILIDRRGKWVGFRILRRILSVQIFVYGSVRVCTSVSVCQCVWLPARAEWERPRGRKGERERKLRVCVCVCTCMSSCLRGCLPPRFLAESEL